MISIEVKLDLFNILYLMTKNKTKEYKYKLNDIKHIVKFAYSIIFNIDDNQLIENILFTVN